MKKIATDTESIAIIILISYFLLMCFLNHSGNICSSKAMINPRAIRKPSVLPMNLESVLPYSIILLKVF